MAETLVVLVSGRGALANLAGVPSVERHVRAGRRLGLEVVVVYPPERRALGTEVRGLVEADAACIPSDEFAKAKPAAGAPVLVVAAEWYLSLAALAAVRDSQEARLFGRVCERGCTSVPVARIGRDDAVAIAKQLGSASAATALAALVGPGAVTLDLDSRSEQRLSDNVSAGHAEAKLVETLFGPPRFLRVLRLRPVLAPWLARRLRDSALGPVGISAVKLALGLVAAWILEGGSYSAGVAGALLYFAARVLGASGIVLARASASEDDIREKLDLAGDTVLHVALLWSLAGGAARGPGSALLAAVATAGVLISTAVAYVFVVRRTWDARRPSAAVASLSPATAGADGGIDVPVPSGGVAGDEFVSRFVQRDGIAYALLFAAFAARLDLLLWAAAIASHLFYVLWLLARPRRTGGAMPLGSAA